MSLGEPYGLAGPATQVIKLGPSGLAASYRLDIEDIGRVKRENSLDTLIADDSPDSECFVNAPAFAGDYCAGKDLRSLFVAFFDTAMNLDDITYLEMWDFALKTFALNGI